MKRTLFYTVFLLTLGLFTGCKTNNGDIGIWYGLWSLERMAVDGVEDKSLDSDGWTNFAFQNNVVLITRTTPLADVTECYGTWHEENGEIDFDYNHRDDMGDYAQSIYDAPAWLYFTPKGVTRCKILSSTSKVVTLQQITSDGKTVTYYLRKQH